MTETDTVTLPRRDYEDLLARLQDLEDIAAAREAELGGRIPHEIATAIMRGANPVRAWREYRGLSLRGLAGQAGMSASYLSEIERGTKPGSADALRRLAQALSASMEGLMAD